MAALADSTAQGTYQADILPLNLMSHQDNPLNSDVKFHVLPLPQSIWSVILPSSFTYMLHILGIS